MAEDMEEQTVVRGLTEELTMLWVEQAWPENDDKGGIDGIGGELGGLLPLLLLLLLAMLPADL